MFSTISVHTGERPAYSIAVVGNDAVLEALPSHPIQLSHACLQAGYAMAVPASWGDELVAEEALRRLTERGDVPAILCTCPRVRERLFYAGVDLARFVLSLVPPSVAVGRYLRAIMGRRGLRLVYVGGCAGGSDTVYDAHFLPGEFLAHLRARGISLDDQPRVFESIVPPDRRRFVSLPGGCPTPEALAQRNPGRSVHVLDAQELTAELAQALLSRKSVLIDVATRLGCECSGMVRSASVASARIAVTSLEPPRAAGSVIDASVPIVLDATLPISGSPRDTARPLPVFAERGDVGLADRVLSVDDIERERASGESTSIGMGAAPSAEHESASSPAPITKRERPAGVGTEEIIDASTISRRPASGSFRAVRARRREGTTVRRAYLAIRRGSSTTPSDEHAAWPGTDRERALDVTREPLPLSKNPELAAALEMELGLLESIEVSTDASPSATVEATIVETDAPTTVEAPGVEDDVPTVEARSVESEAASTEEAPTAPVSEAERAPGIEAHTEPPVRSDTDVVPETPMAEPPTSVTTEAPTATAPPEAPTTTTYPEPLRVYVEEEIDVGPREEMPSERRHVRPPSERVSWAPRVTEPDEHSAIRTGAVVAFLTALTLVVLYLLLEIGR